MNRRGGAVARAPRLRRGLRGGGASVDGGKTAVVVRVGVSARGRVRRPLRTLGVVLVEVQVQVQATGHRGRRRLVVVLVQTVLLERFRSSLACGDDGGGVGGRRADGRTTSAATGWFDRGGGPAQGRGVLPDERFEGEPRGKLHRTRHLDHSYRERRRGGGGLRLRRGVSFPSRRAFSSSPPPRAAAVVPPVVRTYLNRLRCTTSTLGSLTMRRTSVADVPSHPSLSHLRSSVSGVKNPSSNDASSPSADPSGAELSGSSDGEVPEGLVPHARVPARLARQRRGDRSGEVPARGAQGCVQRHHALRFGSLEPTVRVAAVTSSSNASRHSHKNSCASCCRLPASARACAAPWSSPPPGERTVGGSKRRGEDEVAGVDSAAAAAARVLRALVRRPPRRHQPAHGAVYGPVVEPPSASGFALRRARELLQPAEHLERGVEVTRVAQIPQTRGARHRTSGDRRGAFGVRRRRPRTRLWPWPRRRGWRRGRPAASRARGARRRRRRRRRP